jgi:hypothetical protein
MIDLIFKYNNIILEKSKKQILKEKDINTIIKINKLITGENQQKINCFKQFIFLYI